jgi:hypothetical protein
MHGRGLERQLDDLVGRRETPNWYSTRLEMLDGFGGGSTPRVIKPGNKSGASGFIASSTSMTCGSTS